MHFDNASYRTNSLEIPWFAGMSFLIYIIQKRMLAGHARMYTQIMIALSYQLWKTACLGTK